MNPLDLLDSHLGRAAAGAAIAGGGAMAYNATTQPTLLLDQRGRPILDENGQPIVADENDINPYLVAATGAGLGAGSRFVQDGAVPFVQQHIMRRRQTPQTTVVEPQMSDEEFYGGNW